MKTTVVVAIALLTLVLPISAIASSIKVLTLDRGGVSQSFTNYAGFSAVRSDLLNTSLFSESGIVTHSVSLLPAVGQLDAAVLSIADIVLINTGSVTISVEEGDALSTYVEDGGSLFLFGNDINNFNSVTGASSAGYSGTGLTIKIVDGSSPIASGPFGSLPTGTTFPAQFHGRYSGVGANGSVVMRDNNGAGSVFGATFEVGLGRIVALGDEEIFLSSTPGTNAVPRLTGTSRTVFRNSIAYLIIIPEPTTALLAAVGLLAFTLPQRRKLCR